MPEEAVKTLWDKPKATPRSRVVVVETVYHQSLDGSSPVSVDNRYARMLETDEQPYNRTLKIGHEWQALDAGWLKAQVETGALGMVLLKNEDRDKKGVIDVALQVGDVLVALSNLPGGETFRIPSMSNFDKLRVRTQIDRPVRLTLHLIPR